MNYTLDYIPFRTAKPRKEGIGITMMMDKGLSLAEVSNFLSVASEHTDIVKLGWATSFVTPHLAEKIALYKAAGIPVYLGGTLFEAFVIRDKFDDYLRILADFQLDYAEVSDGSMSMPHATKCNYIQKLVSAGKTVLSEVGSKDAAAVLSESEWISQMKAELAAGAWKVIAEARESGNVGVYQADGQARQDLVDKIVKQIPFEQILWESPQKAQQVFFIKLLGANVNLGNIAPNEVISLETIRLGLRGDTFHHFLEKDHPELHKTPLS